MQTPPSVTAAVLALGLTLLVGCGSSPGAAGAEGAADTSGPGGDDAGGGDTRGIEDARATADIDSDEGFPRERTLTCDYEQTQTLDLRTGVVRTVARLEATDDLTCLIARHVGLTAQGDLCVLEAPVPELGDISLPSRCEEEEGIGWLNHHLCGPTTNPFVSVCVGTALVVRAASDGTLYRVLVREDFIDETRGSGVRFVYAPLSD